MKRNRENQYPINIQDSLLSVIGCLDEAVSNHINCTVNQSPKRKRTRQPFSEIGNEQHQASRSLNKLYFDDREITQGHSHNTHSMEVDSPPHSQPLTPANDTGNQQQRRLIHEELFGANAISGTRRRRRDDYEKHQSNDTHDDCDSNDVFNSKKRKIADDSNTDAASFMGYSYAQIDLHGVFASMDIPEDINSCVGDDDYKHEEEDATSGVASMGLARDAISGVDCADDAHEEEDKAEERDAISGVDDRADDAHEEEDEAVVVDNQEKEAQGSLAEEAQGSLEEEAQGSLDSNAEDTDDDDDTDGQQLGDDVHDAPSLQNESHAQGHPITIPIPSTTITFSTAISSDKNNNDNGDNDGDDDFATVLNDHHLSFSFLSNNDADDGNETLSQEQPTQRQAQHHAEDANDDDLVILPLPAEEAPDAHPPAVLLHFIFEEVFRRGANRTPFGPVWAYIWFHITEAADMFGEIDADLGERIARTAQEVGRETPLYIRYSFGDGPMRAGRAVEHEEESEVFDGVNEENGLVDAHIQFSESG